MGVDDLEYGDIGDPWEVESLGQRALVDLLRRALDARLSEPRANVREREEVERDTLREVLRRAAGEDES